MEPTIRAWMANAILEERYESATKLAEDCAIALEHPEWLDGDLHIVWDLAVEYIND